MYHEYPIKSIVHVVKKTIPNHEPSVDGVDVVGWRLIDDRQLFGYLSSLVLWGEVGWGGIITSCLSAFHTYLPHGRHCLLGGVGY